MGRGAGVRQEEDLERTRSAARCPAPTPTPPSSERHRARHGRRWARSGGGNHFLECRWWTRSTTSARPTPSGWRGAAWPCMIHCGSRGFGHQVCTDYLQTHAAGDAQVRHRAAGPPAGLRAGGLARRRQLPWRHGRRRRTTPGPTARSYLALRARRCEQHLRRQPGARWACAWSTTSATTSPSSRSTRSTGGRGGSVRAPQGRHARLPGRATRRRPEVYREVGPAGADTGRHGHGELRAGGHAARRWSETCGCTCHGAGRVMSRQAANRPAERPQIARELAEAGIIVRAERRSTLAEEMPGGLQGRGRGGRGDARGGHHAQGGAPAADGRGEGLKSAGATPRQRPRAQEEPVTAPRRLRPRPPACRLPARCLRARGPAARRL